MVRPASPSNVASNSAATSAWANSVVNAINATLNDIYGATLLTIPYTALTGVFGSTTPTVVAFGDSAAPGVGGQPARNDHRHGVPAFGAVVAETAYGGTSANGTAGAPVRSDHKHGTPAAQTAASLLAPTTYNTPATGTTRRVYVGTSTPTGASEGDVWVQG